MDVKLCDQQEDRKLPTDPAWKRVLGDTLRSLKYASTPTKGHSGPVRRGFRVRRQAPSYEPPGHKRIKREHASVSNQKLSIKTSQPRNVARRSPLDASATTHAGSLPLVHHCEHCSDHLHCIHVDDAVKVINALQPMVAVISQGKTPSNN